ncbi:unnamed protein product [Urochloa humidicola]
MKGTYETDVIMDNGTVIQTTLMFSGDAVKGLPPRGRQQARPLPLRRHRHGLTERCVVVPETGHPKNKMDVLQLCVGLHGLAFRNFHANHAPAVLKDFFACRVPTTGPPLPLCCRRQQCGAEAQGSRILSTAATAAATATA